MAKRTGPTNIQLQKLIIELRKLSVKQKAPIWKRVAEDLSKSTRQRRKAHLDRINKTVKKDETVLVPGKVLSQGELTNKITIAAYSFSEKAKEKINASGKAISIEELMKTNPKGKKVRIIG